MPAGASPPAPARSATPAVGIDPKQAYADWYTSARGQGLDHPHCHAVAYSAVTSHFAGADHGAVTRAAHQVAQATRYPVSQADQVTQAYANWYAWAIVDLTLSPERARVAADAAVQGQMQGLTPEAAAEHAFTVMGVPRRPAPSNQLTLDSFLVDPALWSLFIGIASVLILIFTSGGYFVASTISGLFVGFRALGKGHRGLALIAILLNALGLLFGSIALLLRVSHSHPPAP